MENYRRVEASYDTEISWLQTIVLACRSGKCYKITQKLTGARLRVEPGNALLFVKYASDYKVNQITKITIYRLFLPAIQKILSR